MKITIVQDHETMSKQAAELLANEIKQDPQIALGLATGGTVNRMYELLTSMNLNWKEVTTFNLDEYVGLPNNHPKSYHYYMKKNLFDKTNIDLQATHFPDNEGNLEQNGWNYDQLIGKKNGIKLQVLGIGINGHIGFNEPPSDKHTRTRPVQLSTSTIKANARYFDAIQDVPTKAMSMGIGSILGAKKILLLASGETKAAAIAKTIEGPVTQNVPASFLQEHPDVTIIIDRAAAQDLKRNY